MGLVELNAYNKYVGDQYAMTKYSNRAFTLTTLIWSINYTTNTHSMHRFGQEIIPCNMILIWNHIIKKYLP